MNAAESVADRATRSGYDGPPLYRIVSTALALAAVVLAAAILDPAASPNPQSDTSTQLYAFVVILIGFALGCWWLFNRQRNRDRAWASFSRSFLISSAAGLFLVGRVTLSAVLVVSTVGTVILIAEYADLSGSERLSTVAGPASVLILLWIAIIGIESLYISGRYSLPLVAATTAAAACQVRSSAPVPVDGSWQVGVIALIGAEIAFALRFVNLTPVLSATLWMVAILFALALVNIPHAKATR